VSSVKIDGRKSVRANPTSKASHSSLESTYVKRDREAGCHEAWGRQRERGKKETSEQEDRGGMKPSEGESWHGYEEGRERRRGASAVASYNDRIIYYSITHRARGGHLNGEAKWSPKASLSPPHFSRA